MHAIIALGLGLTLATPATADVRVEQGVRVHRGGAAAATDGEAARHSGRVLPASPVAARRMVVLDRRYGSGTARWRLTRP